MKKVSALLSLLVFCVSFSIQANGELEAVVEYDGEESKEVFLNKMIQVTRTRTEMRDSTCTRSEPYQTQECNYETRYRNECSWQPGRTVCRDVPDRTCRNVTRYRQQCSTGPSRQVCRNEPSRRVCRTRNGQQVCRDVPGRRVCRSVPGQRTCRQVPYTDRVCSTTSRRVCDTTPGRNVCRDVAYQEYVCRTVTRYRDVTYSCQEPVEVPYQADVEYQHKVEFSFDDEDQIGAATFNIKAIDDFLDVIAINNNDQSFIQLERSTQFVQETETTLEFKSTVAVTFGSIEELVKPLSMEVKKVLIDNDGMIKIRSKNAEVLKDARLDVVVAKKENEREILFGKTFLAKDLKITEKGININLLKAGFTELKELGGQDVKVSLRVVVDPPRRLALPIGQSLTVNKDFDAIVEFKNFDAILAPLSAEFSGAMIDNSGMLVIKTENSEVLKNAAIKLQISESPEENVFFAETFNLSSFEVVGNGLAINLLEAGFDEIASAGGTDLDIKVTVIVTPPRGANIPGDVATTKTHNLQAMVSFANIDEIMAPVRAEVKVDKLTRKGMLEMSVSYGAERLSGASLELIVKKKKDEPIVMNLDLSDFDVDGDKMIIDLAKYGFSEIRGFSSKKVDLTFNVVINAPRGFDVPVGESLKRTHSFKVKAVKK